MITEFVFSMCLALWNGIFRFFSMKRRFFSFPNSDTQSSVPTICYAVTASDESVELQTLLNQLFKHKRNEDEILLLLDASATTKDVRRVVEIEKSKIDTMIEFPLNRDFASFKNHIIDHTRKDYIFQIDADELISPFLINSLPYFLAANREVEMFRVARINLLIDDEMSLIDWEDLPSVSEREYIHFPDYQYRVLKNNTNVRWIRSLHEILTGFRSYSYLPKDKEYCLLHCKRASKHTKRWWNNKG